MNPFFYLAITIVIEFIAYAVTIRKKIPFLLFYCILVNLFTWPLANLFYGVLGLFFIIELCVFAVESVLIKYLLDISWKKAMIISFIANLITALIGLIV